MIEHVIPSSAENMEMDPYVNPYSRPQKMETGSRVGSGMKPPVPPKRMSLENLDKIGIEKSQPPMTVYQATGSNPGHNMANNGTYSSSSNQSDDQSDDQTESYLQPAGN